MAINHDDGLFQACYWLSAETIEGDPDGVEYSDFLMELKQSIDQALRRRRFAYAALFRWTGAEWELVEEFERRTG